MIYFGSLIILLAIIVLIILIRNEVVYRIRIKAIHDEKDLRDNLPSYNTMVHNPKQWYMWTYNQYSKRYK